MAKYEGEIETLKLKDRKLIQAALFSTALNVSQSWQIIPGFILLYVVAEKMNKSIIFFKTDGFENWYDLVEFKLTCCLHCNSTSA
jgi:hypothetical protein